MTNRWLASGAACCALSIAAGALGAHLLAARLTPHELGLWETACRYFFYGGCGQALAGLWGGGSKAVGRPPRGWAQRAGWCLAVGSVVFSGTIGAIALGGPAFLGAVTPLGGILLIVGFVFLAFAARLGS
jgi:uncharacterized membrane protein YgdD (TMEM256/DUF423 family)